MTIAVTNQEQISFSTPSVVDTIRDMARESTYSYEQMKYLSNNIGPRLSGSPKARPVRHP